MPLEIKVKIFYYMLESEKLGKQPPPVASTGVIVVNKWDAQKKANGIISATILNCLFP